MRGKFASAYYPKSYKLWRERFAKLVRPTAPPDPIAFPVSVEVTLSCKRPKKPANSFPKGDIDNYVKSVLDGLQAAGVLADDKFVISLSAGKYYTQKPWIAVIIQENPSAGA